MLPVPHSYYYSIFCFASSSSVPNTVVIVRNVRLFDCTLGEKHPVGSSVALIALGVQNQNWVRLPLICATQKFSGGWISGLLSVDAAVFHSPLNRAGPKASLLFLDFDAQFGLTKA